MKKLLAVAAFALAGTAAIAQTAPQPAPARPMADGAMTRAETVAMVRDHFARLDGDRDGTITTAEVTARRGAMAQRMREGGPRRLAMRDPGAAFDRIDANKDGMISREEFASVRQQRIEKRVERRVERREGARDGQQRVMRMHRRGGGMGAARMIVMADTNRDGRITLAEAEALALQHFDRMDANRDGRVTIEERRAARPMMMQMRHAPTAG